MEYRRLGRTGLRVSVVGLGSGGASKLGQTYDLPQTEVRRLVRRALDLGINMLDTAPVYGESEALLGAALDGVPRDQYILATKFLPLQGETLRSAADLRASCEESLRRLRTDYVDILYLHALQPAWTDRTLDALLPTLHSLRDEGKVRFLGVTEHWAGDHARVMLRNVLPRNLFEVVMAGHNLLSPSALLQVFPLAQAHDVGVVVMCPVRKVLAQPDLLRETLRGWKEEGLLAADALPDDRPLDWLLGPGVETIPAAAYKFAAAHPAINCVLSGSARIEHLEANVAAVLGPPLPAAKAERARDLFAPVMRNIQV